MMRAIPAPIANALTILPRLVSLISNPFVAQDITAPIISREKDIRKGINKVKTHIHPTTTDANHP
jgi:hypothetical protein